MKRESGAWTCWFVVIACLVAIPSSSMTWADDVQFGSRRRSLSTDRPSERAARAQVGRPRAINYSLPEDSPHFAKIERPVSQDREQTGSELEPGSSFSDSGSNIPDWIRSTGPLLSSRKSLFDTVPQPGSVEWIRSNKSDGTWCEDDQYIVINLDGRELKLRKDSSDGDEKVQLDIAALAAQMKKVPVVASGSVYGRLMNRGRPVAECRVSLIPLKREYGGYAVNGGGKPQSTVTDKSGNYEFENIPTGPYKMFWLPRGRNQWIRRIEYNPDVRVRNGETSRIKDIRVSLRTVN